MARAYTKPPELVKAPSPLSVQHSFVGNFARANSQDSLVGIKLKLASISPQVKVPYSLATTISLFWMDRDSGQKEQTAGGGSMSGQQNAAASNSRISAAFGHSSRPSRAVTNSKLLQVHPNKTCSIRSGFGGEVPPGQRVHSNSTPGHLHHAALLCKNVSPQSPGEEKKSKKAGSDDKSPQVRPRRPCDPGISTSARYGDASGHKVQAWCGTKSGFLPQQPV